MQVEVVGYMKATCANDTKNQQVREIKVVYNGERDEELGI